MSKTTNKFSPGVRERAVRLVPDNEGQHESRWQAVMSISATIGCAVQTLDEWVKRAEVDCGKRAGNPVRHGREDEDAGAGEPRTAPGQRDPAQGKCDFAMISGSSGIASSAA